MSRRTPRSRRFARQPLAWAALQLVALAGNAFAQAGPQRVEVVGVTPLGGEGVPVGKTPANVQTIKAREIGEQGATNVADLLDDNIGSVTVSNAVGNPYQNDVNYRGFQATSMLGAPVGVSVYFDGVRMNEPFGSLVNWDLIPMNAVSRASLIPGSNPIFGLNTLGGAIALETKNGKDNPERSIGLTLGSFGRRAVTFEAGGSAGERADWFVAGNLDRQDGWREHSASEVRQLFGKLRWRADGERTLVQLSAALADNDLHGTQALPLDMMDTPRAAYTWPDNTANTTGVLSLNASRWLGERDKLVGNLFYRDARSRVGNSNAALDDGCFNADGTLAQTAGVARCADKAPGGTAVNAVTGANALALGYGRWTRSINTSQLDSTIRQRTGGTSLQWWNFDRLLGRDNTLTVGGSLDQSRITYGQQARLARLVDHAVVETPNMAYGFTADGLAPSATNLPAFTGSNLVSAVDLSSTTRNLSLYFTDKLDLTGRFSVTASGSWNLTRIDQTGRNAQYLNTDGGASWTDDVSGVSYVNPDYAAAWRYANSGTGTAANPVGSPAGAVAGPETNGLDGSHRYHRFNPAIGFTYDAGKALGLFGGYSEAMRAPTSIELSCADPNNPCALPTGFNGDPELKPVIARTVELGVRGELGGQLSWNAAVYDTRLKDDIQFIATSSTYGYFSNVGTTERRGLELGLQARWDSLRLSASYGRVDARYRSAFTTAAGADVSPGDRIPGIPRDSLKLRASWQATPDLRLGGTLVAVGRQYAHGNEDNRDPEGVVPGYALVNADLRWHVLPALELFAKVSNLFDRRYSTYGLSGGTSIYTLQTQTFFTPAPPRAFTLGLSWSLGG